MSKAELINESLAEPFNVKGLFDTTQKPVKCFVVHVTPEDIERGIPKQSQRCPIARAFTRLCKDNGIPLRHLAVTSDGLQAETPWGNYGTTLPDIAKSFIRQYDEWGPKEVHPIDFTLDPSFEEFLLQGTAPRRDHCYLPCHSKFDLVAA